MQKYIIKKISEEKAQHIWNVSSNASIYTNPNFLKLQKGKYYWICAYKGDEEICAWPLMIEKKKSF